VAKYMVLYRSKMTAGELMAQSTPEQAQAGMEAWRAWAEQAGDAVVDVGTPTAVVDPGGDSGDPIGGYSILQADSNEALDKVLEDHPHKTTGGTIETLECLQMPGM
jgi:YCII-related domain-containing protein